MHEKWRQMPPLLFLRHDGKISDLFIELQGITKRFPGVVANDRVGLAVHRGEIHAIVGENGAGKSTLMRVLYGLYQPDEGTIAVKGHAVTIESPRRALELGIGMVHQHFMLIPVFTVAENVILGSEPVWGFGRLRMREAQQRVAELCRQYGFVLDPTAEVGSLSVGEQQRVEIIKVLYRGAELLILDEPTAVLVPQEVDELFNNLRQLVAQGKTVIFISHKLDEVLAISDQITVLRRGRVVGTVPAAGTTKAQLAEMMVGRPVLMALWENMILGHHTREEFTHGALLNRPGIRGFVRRRVGDYDIRVADVEAPVLALSGGNQQKVVVAREFSFAPQVLVAAQPTRGLDIGATEFVMRQLLAARSSGMAVLLVSANLEEILSLSDRVGVMYGGALVAEFARGEVSAAELGLYMTGAGRTGEARAG